MRSLWGVDGRKQDVRNTGGHVKMREDWQLHRCHRLRHGSAERGRTVFDGVLANYPKRLDVWSVYLDMELRQGEEEHIRRLFERTISLRVSSKKVPAPPRYTFEQACRDRAGSSRTS